jgi:hypothetical protein
LRYIDADLAFSPMHELREELLHIGYDSLSIVKIGKEYAIQKGKS